jgi:hypothetical protein
MTEFERPLCDAEFTKCPQLHSYKDDSGGCYSNIRMNNGDPCFVSVARSGVLVKRSRTGLFGAKLYKKDAYESAMTAAALDGLYPKRLTPEGMTNPVLVSFTNVILHCSSLSEASTVLNEAVEKAGSAG